MNADFYVIFAVRVIIVASGRARSLLALPGHWEPLGCKSTMANGRQACEWQQGDNQTHCAEMATGVGLSSTDTGTLFDTCFSRVIPHLRV